MKKLFTLTLVFLFGIGFSSAENSEDNNRYRNYSKNFIFNQDGIEFAVFPDGQFDFNYLQDRNGVSVFVNSGNTQISFNSGYDYDRFVQYDTYGAVIQIEQIPVFYDSYGRVNQIGNVDIFYNNGFINRIGNLRVYYSRPGIINYYDGYINTFNRNYVYQPWHNFYSVPFTNRCIVYNNPYRASYFPIRYAWSYHVSYWNSPSYYNGCYSRANLRRNFYRPNDRVNYRSFERGRRDSRGRAVAINSRTNRNRTAISSGRSQVTRSTRGRSTASNGRNTTSTGRSTGIATRNATTGRNSQATSTRSTGTRNSTATSTRSNTRNNRVATAGNRSTRTVTAAPNRSSRTSNDRATTRNTRTQTAAPSRSTRTPRATSTRSNRTSNNTRATAPRTSSRNTQARTSRASTSRNNTQARSTRSSSAKKKTSTSSRSNRRG